MVKIGSRIIRGFAASMSLGLVLGFSVMLIARGINLQAEHYNLLEKIINKPPEVNELAYFFTVLGFTVASGLSIELSYDIDQTEARDLTNSVELDLVKIKEFFNEKIKELEKASTTK